MFRFLFELSLLLFTASPWIQTPLSPAEIQATLSRGEKLYFEAQFKESIQLLTALDVDLTEHAGSVPEHVKVKLQLALAYIGINDSESARKRFVELFRLDPSYELDPFQYAPKVLTLFGDVRNDQSKARCSANCDEAKRLLNAGNLQALLVLFQTNSKTCSCVEIVGLDAADMAFKQGVDEYKNDDIPASLKTFKMALDFNPDHDLAAQYIDLAENKLQLTADRLLLDWRKHFDAGEFPQAGVAYNRVVAFGPSEKTTPSLDQIRTEYRKQVSRIAETWKQDCSTATPSMLSATVQRATDMLPDPAIARDIIDQIKPCIPPPTVEPQPPVRVTQVVAPEEPCLKLPSAAAMVRLKTRVDPTLPRALLPISAVSFNVLATIDKGGNVKVHEVQGGGIGLKGPLKTAVEQWKFNPAIVGADGKPRCVETELNIRLNP